MEQTDAHEKVMLQIQGMTCSACALRLENGLTRLPGIDSAFVNLPLETAYLRYNPAKIEFVQISDKIKQLGFTVSATAGPASFGRPTEPNAWADVCRNRFIGALLLTLPLLWPMAAHLPWAHSGWVPLWIASPWTQLALATVVQLVWGLPFLDGALRSLLRGAVGMDLLVALGTTSAYLYSHYLLFHPGAAGHTMLYFETSAVLITVIWLGKWLEAQARQRVQASMRQKLSLLPALARRLTEEGEEEVSSSLLRKGDRIRLSAGDLIPADGVVAGGEGLADESSLNGESLPRELRSGDRLHAGARMVTGEIEATVEAAGVHSSLGKMIRALEEAQSVRTSMQVFADRAALWLVPIVLVLSVSSGLYWYGFGEPGELGHALRIAVAVLVCACPCAAGLAAPLSVFIGSRRAAERGILFRSGEAMEALHRADTMIVDKTGTLTRGMPAVTGMVTDRMPQRELLQRVASVEQTCEHPIAGALVREAGRQGIPLHAAGGVEPLPGLGVRGRVGAQELVVGSAKLMRGLGIACPAREPLRGWEEQGKTVMHIAVDGQWAGAVAVTDALRADTAATLRRLRAAGLRTVLATGDSAPAALHAARLTGIGELRASCLPADKLALVRERQQRGRRVVMVGDGQNDAAAMAAADCSIAVGNATEAAKEAAAVHVLRDDFDAIREAFAISRETVRNMKQNLGWAFAYNALMLPAAAAGQIEPWAAGAAMTASSLTVVLNALRLHYRLRGGKP